MRGEFVREDLPTTARCEPRSAACCRTRIARPGGAPWRLWALGHLAGVSVCRQGSNRSISSARGTGPGARVTGGARPGSAVTSIDACRYLTAVDVGSGTRVAPSVPHGRLRRRLGRRGLHDHLEAMFTPPPVDLLSRHLRRRAEVSPWLPALDPGLAAAS